MAFDWQPLETAPKDGTHFLFYFEGNVYTAWYEEFDGSCWHIASPDDNCWCDIWDPNPPNSLWCPIIYPNKLQGEG